MQQLNSIVHPRLKDEIVKIVESRTLNVEHRIIVINAAVLKEIGLIDFCDEVWVVMASRETRFKRLMKTGLTKPEALKRIRAQAAQKEYLGIADKVIGNNGTLKQLNAKVQAGLKV